MEGIIFLEIKEIQYLHSDGSYTEFHTSADGKILVSKSIKEYENLLPDTLFCRIHQSFIVNINYVKKFMKEDGGYAILKDGTQIPISRRKKERFLNMIMG